MHIFLSEDEQLDGEDLLGLFDDETEQTRYLPIFKERMLFKRLIRKTLQSEEQKDVKEKTANHEVKPVSIIWLS